MGVSAYLVAGVVAKPSVAHLNTVVALLLVVVLAEGVAFPVFRQQDTAQIRMAGKPDAKEVKRFAFMPVCRLPNA